MHHGSLGRRVLELRIRSGLSQTQLAAPEFSGSYISLIESGKRQPAQRTIAILARKLGCTSEYLEHGLTDKSLAALTDRLRRAEAALADGSAADALARFSELVATPALRAGAPRLHQRARRGHAMSLEARGRAEEAVQELERAAQTVKGLDWDEWAAVQECLCRCHRRRGDLVEAVAVADRALACLHLEERPATDAAIRIGVHLLEAHRSLGDAFTARRLAGRLVRTVESGAGAGAGAGARARARLTVYAHAAAVFEEHGDHATAVTLAERAMAAAAEQETGRADALDAVERAGLLTLLGRPGAERARLLLCARERELARAGDRPRALGVCVAERARIELAMGCPAEAVAQARRAHTLLAGPPSRAAARALAVLGHGLVQLDRLPAAIETLTRGAECLEHAGYVRQAARAWYDVAEAIGRTGGGHRRRALAYRHALALIGLAAEPALPNPPPR